MAHRRTPQADLDLDEIWYYIAKETGNVETARGQVQSITERFYSISGDGTPALMEARKRRTVLCGGYGWA